MYHRRSSGFWSPSRINAFSDLASSSAIASPTASWKEPRTHPRKTSLYDFQATRVDIRRVVGRRRRAVTPEQLEEDSSRVDSSWTPTRRVFGDTPDEYIRFLRLIRVLESGDHFHDRTSCRVCLVRRTCNGGWGSKKRCSEERGNEG